MSGCQQDLHLMTPSFPPYALPVSGDWELQQTGGVCVDQVIRPTVLIDPICIIRPTESQVDDLIGECRDVAARGMRTLVTTLTKRMAEDLTEYLHEAGLKEIGRAHV